MFGLDDNQIKNIVTGVVGIATIIVIYKAYQQKVAADSAAAQAAARAAADIANNPLSQLQQTVSVLKDTGVIQGLG